MNTYLSRSTKTINSNSPQNTDLLSSHLSDMLELGSQESTISSTSLNSSDNSFHVQRKHSQSLRTGGEVIFRPGISWIECATHTIALASTVAIAYINIAEVYVDDANTGLTLGFVGKFNLNQQDLLHALQIPVKVYELVLASSLAIVVLHFIRHRLTGPEGVPFGLLLSGYELSSPWTLFKAKWHKPLRHHTRRQMSFNDSEIFVMSIMIGVVVVLSNIIGPAAGITIIPSLQWWSMKKPFNNVTMPIYFAPNSLNDLYPTSVSATSAQLASEPSLSTLCSGSIGLLADICPVFGFQELDNWINSNLTYGTHPNITMPVELASTERLLTSQITSNGTTIAFTIPQLIARILDWWWYYVHVPQLGIMSHIGRPRFTSTQNTDNGHHFAPLVQVQCRMHNSSTFSRNELVFPSDKLINLSAPCAQNYDQNQRWAVPEIYGNMLESLAPDQKSLLKFNWISVSGHGFSPSIGALVTMPAVYNDHAQEKIFFPCLFDARWAAISVQFDPTISNLVTPNVSNPSIFTNMPESCDLSPRQKWGLGDPISIDPSWAAFLNENVNSNNLVPQWALSLSPNISKPSVNSIEYLLSWYVSQIDWTNNNKSEHLWSSDSDTYFPLEDKIATVLGLVLADGLARISTAANPWVLSSSTSISSNTSDGMPSNVASSTQNILLQQIPPPGFEEFGTNFWFPTKDLTTYSTFDMVVSRYGWGYGVTGSSIVWPALIVLLGSAAIIVIYLIYKVRSIFMGTTWTSDAWGDVGDTLKLALLSEETRALRLDSKNSAQWVVNIRVRERSPNRLHLVVGGSLELKEKLPRKGRRYSP